MSVYLKFTEHGCKHTHNFHNAATLVWGSLRLAPNHCYMLFYTVTVGYNRECLVSSFSNRFTEISGKSHKGKFPQYMHWVEVTYSFFSFISRYPATRKQPKVINKCLTSGHILKLCPPTHWTKFALYSSDFGWVHMCQSECICVSLSTYAVICVHLHVSTRICMWHFRD